MAARDGCAYLISRLRKEVNDGGTVTWSNDELQDLLDAHRRYVAREELRWAIGERSGGTPLYKEAISRWRWYEQTVGGTARFLVQDVTGSAIGTAEWSASYIAGQVSFSSSQGGSARYLTGYSFDLHGAAADCWRDQAGITSAYYNIQQGSMRMSRSDWFEHCQRMAQIHDGLRQPQVVEIFTDGDY